MANSEDMQAVIMQLAIWAAVVVLRAIREADLLTQPHTRRSSPEEPQRPRQAEPILIQPAFDGKVSDMYVELLNFKMKVANVLQTKA